jgi:7,8-dihydropterin-6-yl-methyl-4-(beta-D-ribofuranosyl)aminobenzene 5'-phosphate synthase
MPPKTVTFTVLYDNHAYASGLKTAWGFACLVKMDETVVLFDTGGDSATLLSNMAALGKDPQAIRIVVLSHFHSDHTSGLDGLLDTGIQPHVYVPDVFPTSFKDAVRTRTALIAVEEAQEICPGVFTTGQVRGSVVEQALVVETAEGAVVLTGCAHPGVVEMAQAAQQITDNDITWVMGGFHLGNTSQARIRATIQALRELEVDQVAPMHCTGDQARAMFAETWGEACHLLGVGAEITLPR